MVDFLFKDTVGVRYDFSDCESILDSVTIYVYKNGSQIESFTTSNLDAFHAFTFSPSEFNAGNAVIVSIYGNI